jgi:copper amine oxidase domain protein
MTALASPPVLEGWKQNDIGWWYRQVDGTYPSDSWKNINKKWYYFNDNGYMVEDSWVENYYLGSDSAMLVNTIIPDGHYVLDNGEKTEDILTENDQRPELENSELGNLIGPGAELSDNYENVVDSLAYEGIKEVSTENNTVLDNVDSLTGDGFKEVSNDNTADTNTLNNFDENNDTANQETPSAIESGITTVPTIVIPNDNVDGESERARVIRELREYGLSEDEANLYYLINEYRESLGLSKLSFSKSLTSVARAHVKDSHNYTPRLQLDERGIQGNLHSWSNNGNWRGGAYTPDHEHAEIMWDKPGELTDYTGAGYEISVYHSIGIDPKLALDLWKSSSGHNEVITGDNDWSFITTMGVAMDKNYSHVWFGGDEDPAGYYDIEGYEVIHP